MTGVIHVVTDGLDEHGSQRCIFCGEYVTDNRNVASIDGAGLRPFAAGDVTVWCGPFGVAAATSRAVDGARRCTEPPHAWTHTESQLA